MLIRNAEIENRLVDVRLEGERIAAIGVDLAAPPGDAILDAEGGALLPGLHDHHLHLFALAAAEHSIPCGPPRVGDAERLEETLRRAAQTAAPDAELRGVDYHESVAGALDRDRLDAWVGDRPVRIQHRTGALWILNGPACERAQLTTAEHPGVERDASGRPTGRVYRADAWLRERLPAGDAPDLGSVGRRLARFGVTGVTDATPTNGANELEAFSRARADGRLPQRLLVMGRGELPTPHAEGIARGPHKVLLSETDFPALDQLTQRIGEQHERGRRVAIHCVTRAELVFALAAFEAAGVERGDRIEHGSIAPPECRATVARLGLTVVTQPNFIAERGEAYRRDVALEDQPHLYCGSSWLELGVRLGGSTDAPFGDPDPWAAMRAAIERRTSDAVLLGPDEALAPDRALALFTTAASDPGGPPRRVAPGALADLCLLDRSWARARADLSARYVRSTFIAGHLVP